MSDHQRNQRLAAVAAAGLCLLALWAADGEARLAANLALLLVCPGYLIERALLRGAALPWLARAALWPALGISSVAALYQWAAAAGVSLPPALLMALTLATALGAAWAVARHPREAGGWPGAWPLVTGAILGLTGLTRVWHVRELAAPAWVDSLHHALLVRAALEQGHAPYALLPYLPIERLTYHSGFHSFVAAALAACGPGACGAPEGLAGALLLAGQLLNALVAAGWAGAALYLWRRPSAAAAAALVVGLASIMPAFYASWGRATLAAGTLLLPAALVLVDLALRRGGRGALAAAALLLAGLSLVHFVALCLALLWGAALVAADAGRGLRPAILRGLAMGGIALALCAPWYAMLLASVRVEAGSQMSVGGEPGYNAMPEPLLWAGSNRLLVALAGVGGLLALRRRRRVGAALLVWCALVALAANPVLVGLPYLSFFTNEFVAITLFGPLSLLIAGGVALLDARLPGRSRHLGPVAALALAAWCASQMQQVVRPDTVLATADDMRAIAWVARNTPAEARFVVNTAGWLYDVDRGADGGWWLLPLAGRQVSAPPVIFTYGGPDFVRGVKAETAWLRDGAGRDPEALAQFMAQRGYGYVFATGRGASVDAARLRASPRFEELHREGDVSIFRTRP